MMIDMGRWQGIDEAEAEAVAATIDGQVAAERFPVRPHEYAGRPGRIALFDVRGEPFALVPGGEVRVR